ncbi:hypothetical protein ACFRMQ_07580 [Kitasatospora sp. NPDC056783]|uniref:hypothetical protein n=1 Tax=Kitasatospora sp. NPDC056783 TaxID=3345943 RepID=UPI0036CA64DB
MTSDPRSRLVGIAPPYLAGGPADYQEVLHLLRRDHGWFVTTHGHGVRALSPCGRVKIHEARWSTNGPALILSEEAPDSSLLWYATISRHTPVEFVLPAVAVLAAALRDGPQTPHSPPNGDAEVDFERWSPAPGWTVTFSGEDYQVHDPPDTLASFVLRRPGPGESSFPRQQEPGYSFFGGPEDSPHHWSAEFSPGSPPAVVAAMYRAVADPAPVVRRPAEVPPFHWPHATIVPLAAPAPARRIAAATRTTTAPPQPPTVKPAKEPAQSPARRRTR